jgi:tetratricopeptide (TPR) repeat protein
MGVLANGLCDAKHHEAAMSVREARLSLARRLGDSEFNILVAKGNLANSYQKLGRHEEALSMRQEVYSGHLKLNGREHPDTLREAENYTLSLFELERFEEARSLLRRIIRVARRVLGASHDTTIRMSRSYAKALAKDPGATLDDLREAVTMLEDTERTARRVLGSAHPITTGIEHDLRVMRDAVEIASAPARRHRRNPRYPKVSQYRRRGTAPARRSRPRPPTPHLLKPRRARVLADGSGARP